MMDLNQFTEEPPPVAAPVAPAPVVITEQITTRYLPTVDVWLAGEPRMEPYAWSLDAKGQFADATHPRVRTQEGRQEKWKVLAYAGTEKSALLLAKMRKEAGV